MTVAKTPHDDFFRMIMADRRFARDFVRAFLPADILAVVNVESLQAIDGTLVDGHLRKHVTDVIFQVDILDTNGYIILLIEHQSTPDKFMPLRVFRYMIKAMERYKDVKSSKPFSVCACQSSLRYPNPDWAIPCKYFVCWFS